MMGAVLSSHVEKVLGKKARQRRNSEIAPRGVCAQLQR